MRRFGWLTALAVLVLFVTQLSGCGQQVVAKTLKESTLVISTDGRLTAYLVGEFDKSYYDLTELAAMAREEAAEFCGAQDSAPVKVESVEAAEDGNSRVVVTYAFDSADSYEGFIEDTLFYGTVEEALAKGYGRGVSLQNVNDGFIMTGQELSQVQGKHLVIFCPKQTEVSKEREVEKHLIIHCPAQVEYLSQGAVLNKDGSVDVSWIEGTEYTPVYILLSK